MKSDRKDLNAANDRLESATKNFHTASQGLEDAQSQLDTAQTEWSGTHDTMKEARQDAVVEAYKTAIREAGPA